MMNNLIYYWMVYMGDVATFLISTSLVLTLLYVPYTLLLRKEHFFRQNRFTLLVILVLSLVLPFCDVPALYPEELLAGLFSKPAPASEAIVEFSSTEQIASTTPLEPIKFAEAHIRPLGILPWLCQLYVVGTLIVLTIRLWQFARIRHLIRKGCLWSDVENGITIHCHTEDVAPCSWMRHIVISEHDYLYHRHEILLHEVGHVRSLHSWDIVLLTLVQTIQWYNPFAYMLGASLRDVHEYEADDYVLRQGVTASEYQTLLLKTAVGNSAYAFANNFNHSLIKNRIIMMKNKKSSPWTRMKALLLLPVALVAVVAISCTSPKEKKAENQLSNVSVKGDNPRLVFIFEDDTEIYIKGEQLNFDNHDANFDYLEPCGLKSENIDGISVLQGEEAEAIFGESGKNGAILFRIKDKTAKDMTTALAEYAQRTGNEEPLKLSIKKPATIDEIQAVGYTPTPKDKDPAAEQGEIFQVVEEMPMFPGGMDELMKFMQTNIRYPKEAQARSIQGRVIVQFVVNKDGSICDEHVVKAVDSQLDAEAIRIIRSMPNWTPGKQRGEPVRVRFTLPVAFRLN